MASVGHSLDFGQGSQEESKAQVVVSADHPEESGPKPLKLHCTCSERSHSLFRSRTHLRPMSNTRYKCYMWLRMIEARLMNDLIFFLEIDRPSEIRSTTMK